MGKLTLVYRRWRSLGLVYGYRELRLVYISRETALVYRQRRNIAGFIRESPTNCVYGDVTL